MTADVLKVVGQVAGIGGLALGILLLLYRDVIRLKIFPRLAQAQAFVVIILILILVWSIAVAGLGVWVWVTTVQRSSPAGSPNGAQSTVTLSPTTPLKPDVPKISQQRSEAQDASSNDRGPDSTAFASISPDVVRMIESKDYNEAIAALKAIIDKQPLHPEANFMLAQARARRFVDLKSKDPSNIVSGFPRFLCEPAEIYLAGSPGGKHAASAHAVLKAARCDFASIWSDTNLDPMAIINRRSAEYETARELRTIHWPGDQ